MQDTSSALLSVCYGQCGWAMRYVQKKKYKADYFEHKLKLYHEHVRFMNTKKYARMESVNKILRVSPEPDYKILNENVNNTKALGSLHFIDAFCDDSKY